MTSKPLAQLVAGAPVAGPLGGQESILILQDGRLTQVPLANLAGYAGGGGSNGAAAPLPPAAAPPSTGVYPVGTWMRNSQPGPGLPWGWVVTIASNPATWAPIQNIGPNINTSPTPYGVTFNKPVIGDVVSGVVQVVIQTQSLLSAVLTDQATGKFLAQGNATMNGSNGTLSLSFDSNQLGNGSRTLLVTATDQLIGSSSAAGHTSSAAVSVTVNNVVQTPGQTTTPPPPTTGTTTSWTPSTATDIEVWLDVGDHASVTDVSGKISQVTDKTTKGHNAVQATGANQPTDSASSINSLYAATFNGVGTQALQVPAATAINDVFAGGGKIAFVLRPKSGGSSNYGRILDKGAWWFETSDAYGVSRMALTVQVGNSVGGFWNVDLSSFNSVMLVEIDYNKDSASNTPTITINGTAQGFVSGATSQPASPPDSDASFPLVIGNSQAGDKPLDADFESLYVWPAAPSSTELANFRSYISSHYNIAVSGAGTAPTSSTPVPGSSGNTATPGTVVAGSPIPSFAKGTGVTPQVTAVASKGYSLIADFTMGSTAGTIKDVPTLAQVATLGLPYPGVTRLNDEIQYYKGIDGTTHVMATDHLKLRASVYSQTLLDAHIARCLATSGFRSPDGHDWGAYQGGPQNGAPPGGYDCGLQSGAITFKNTQRYGYFEAKLQIPNKDDQWPAFWGVAMGGWPPEFDFLEQVKNNNPDNQYNAYHNCALAWKDGVDKNVTPAINQKVAINSLLDNWGSYPTAGGTATDYSAAPHIYAAEWWNDTGRDRWIIYVDNTVVWEGYYPWVFVDTTQGIITGPASPMSVILNLALGGNWAGRLGSIRTATFPIDFLVYWVRFYGK